jgi:acyl-CoA synthetase (AMP-forming)/AMP-acid ligase II
LLAESSRRFPDRPFLIATEPSGQRASVTYDEVYQKVAALTALLAAREVRRGTRVVVVLPNRFELVYLWFAVTALGAALIPLDPRLTDWELAALVEHAQPVLLVLPAGRTAPACSQPILRVDAEFDAAVAKGEQAAMPAQAELALPAAVLYTSGSTGRPKGCLLSHHSFVLPAEHMAGRLRLTPQDVVMHVLPLHHMAGLSLLTTALIVGAGVELVPRFSGMQFWRQAARSEATVFRHLGEMLAVLCAQPFTEGERDQRLRLAYGAGATPAVAAEFTARFGVPTLEGYGLTETNTALCGSLEDRRPGTLGRPLPHVRVRLVGPAGEVSGAGIGELQVQRNPAVTLGYLAEPELTAGAFDGDWFRTGDLVSRDSQGDLRFVRRRDDVIRRRGENIDPTEIERVAESWVGVRRAAAIGVAAELDGIEIKLYLEPMPGHVVRADDVLAHCAEQLAPFKLPRYVEVISRLPLTATQKLDKVALRRFALSSDGMPRP